MTFATIDALRESLAKPTPKVRTPEYAAKMLHAVPDAPVVDRIKFLIDRCHRLRVLELGASGPMHALLLKAAALVVGIDRENTTDVIGFDLDDVRSDLPNLGPFDVIVCGEVLEHLANPGWLCERLRRQYPGVPVVITAPNAFSSAAHGHIEDALENVNIDHVAWYSYRTLRTLVERYGYTVHQFLWYQGDPLTAEGVIFEVR